MGKCEFTQKKSGLFSLTKSTMTSILWIRRTASGAPTGIRTTVEYQRRFGQVLVCVCSNVCMCVCVYVCMYACMRVHGHA